MTIRIPFSGDWHLAGRYHEKAEASIKFMMQHMWEDKNSPAYHPDLIVTGGDLIHRPLHLQSHYLHPFFDFIEASRCKVITVAGTPSHEPFGTIESLGRGRAQIEYFVRPDVRRIEVKPEVFVNVAALPALTKAGIYAWAAEMNLPVDTESSESYLRMHVRNILSGFAAQWHNWTGPKILVGHIATQGHKVCNGQERFGESLEVGLDDLALAQADVVLLDDIHLAQHWDDPCLVIYSGSTHPVNWGELDKKSFVVLEFPEEGGAPTWQRIPFPHKGMVKVELEFTGEQMPDGSWSCDYNGEADIDTELADKEVKVVYTRPRSVADSINDNYVRALFGRHGIDLEVLDGKIKVETRERIENITACQTTVQQYEAVCRARGTEIRPGAIAKAILIDELGIGRAA